MKAAKKFLGQGNRVKVSVLFRGREVQHHFLGRQLLDKITKVFCMHVSFPLVYSITF